MSIIYPKNNNQKRYLYALERRDLPLVIAEGFAGTGKTYMATKWATNAIKNNKYKKIILLRPPQPLNGRTVGFLKGSADEKMQAWVAQLTAYIKEDLGNLYDEYLELGKISIQLLETIRGMSYDDSIVIIDESQLLNREEIQAITTRIGNNSKVIFCGDTRQIESNQSLDSDGLSYLKNIVRYYNINGDIITFTVDDCLRSEICKQFLEAYEYDGWKAKREDSYEIT